MAKFKASKKLIRAIVSFAVSLVMCVGVCLAWFSVNSTVNSDDIDSGVRDGDIRNFTVTAYYLNNAQTGYSKAGTGNVTSGGSTITVDHAKMGVLDSDDDDMRPYGGLFNNFATAILFEIDYELAKSDTNYRITASCPQSSSLSVTPSGSGADVKYVSALSNAVGYYNVNISGGSYYKADSVATTFVNNETKASKRILKSEIIPNADSVAQGKLEINDKGNVTGRTYVILDYIPEQFIYLSTLIIKSGGNLNSSLSFFGDLELNIESYDPATVTRPVSIAPVDSADVRLEQEAGEDIISRTWAFVVTYSDGTTDTVGTSEVVMTNFDTTTAGSRTASVSYTEEGVTVDCDIDYVITERTSQTVEVTSVTLNNTSLNLTVGQTSNLVATIKPANATDKSLTWASSASGVAEVSSNGVVTAKKAGTATITVTSGNGISATCTVTINPKLEYEITFDMNGHGTNETKTTVDGKVSAPSPTADGYTFEGWFENAQGTGSAVNFESRTFTENTTLYAKWTQNAAANLLDGLSGSISKGATLVDNDDLKLTLDGGGATITAITSVTSSDGKTFESYLFPGGGSRTYTVSAKKAITVKFYYTVRDSSGVKNDNVTATVDGVVKKTSSDGTRKDKTVYLMEITLAAGETCVFASAGNRLTVYGIYCE